LRKLRSGHPRERAAAHRGARARPGRAVLLPAALHLLDRPDTSDTGREPVRAAVDERSARHRGRARAVSPGAGAVRASGGCGRCAPVRGLPPDGLLADGRTAALGEPADPAGADLIALAGAP